MASSMTPLLVGSRFSKHQTLNLLEVVYIGLANEAHAEWAMKAMDNLKHVLCEKPMAVNAGQVRAMVEKARQKGVFLMEVRDALN